MAVDRSKFKEGKKKPAPQNEGEDRIVLEYSGKKIILIVTDYDELDTDDLTTIHYHNIVGELLTCSTALNRVGNMLANANELLSEMKLDFEIFMAQMNEEKRKELEFETEDAKGNTKTKTPTVSQVDAAIIRSPKYKVKKKKLIEIQKQVDIINSLYWAVKSKDEKLNKLSDKLRPEDMEREIVEEKVNGILLKSEK